MISRVRWGLVLLAIFSLGFKGNDAIELEGYMNARYSANFLRSTKNVRFVLPPGTKARIQETKTFNSGNSGLLVEVTDGPHKGEEVWVYYNESNPTMRLYKDEADLKADKGNAKVSEAKNAKTTKDTPAIRAPASVTPVKKATVDATDVVRKIEQGNKAVHEHGKVGGPCADCKVSEYYARDLTPRSTARGQVDTEVPALRRAGHDSPLMKPPRRTMNPLNPKSKRCRTPRNSPYDECTYEGDSSVGSFKFYNRGPNSIVPTPREGRSRDWEFFFQGQARQDIYFSVSDAIDGTVSKIQESYFMVFPRKTLPTIRVEGNRQIVTLPNGETVTYDVQSRAIIGGVLSESGAIGGKPKVSYHGNDVLLRVDAVGKDPRIGGTATITKQGRTCRVPTRSLWPNQSASGAMHFKYFSDSDFDAFLKSTCGFGL